MRKKPIITCVEDAVCKNCIYSYQQPISLKHGEDVPITICAHSKHQDHDCDFCEDGIWIVRNRNGCMITETLDELVVELFPNGWTR